VGREGGETDLDLVKAGEGDGNIDQRHGERVSFFAREIRMQRERMSLRTSWPCCRLVQTRRNKVS